MMPIDQPASRQDFAKILQDLKPTQKLLVYDLVKEAGLDVSDWSNYKQPELPQTNPKYCYEWAFFGSDHVVVCLWHKDMNADTNGIFQHLNYQEAPLLRTNMSTVHKQRHWRMDRAFRKAYLEKLPVRVIIVDGPTDAYGDSSVHDRALDPETWHVAEYDEDSGWCHLRRGLQSAAPSSPNASDAPCSLADFGEQDGDLHRIVLIDEVSAFPGTSAPNPPKEPDWEALYRARAELGRLGEELALSAERSRLTDAGRPDLAVQAKLVSDDHTKGYDLHSYETDGRDRLIEVKTVSEDTPTMRFYTSQRQLDLAHSGANHFYYLVRGARSENPRIQAIRAESIPPSAIVPIVHQVIWTESETA